jgi:AcrR family transcriptional regulator
LTTVPNVRTPRTPNKRGEGVRLREEILDAAHGILESTGTEDALTLRAVARAAGVTAPAIYAHFDDRYAILRTVVESTFAELASDMRAAADAHGRTADPIGRLRAVCRAYLTFAADRPHHYRVLFERHRVSAAELGDTGAVNHDVRDMIGADAFGVLLDATAACIESGASRATAPAPATTRIWIGLHGQATLQASLPWFPWPDRSELAESIMTRLADLV